MDRIITLLEKLPTTKIRVLVTVCLIGGTGVVYLMLACHIISTTDTCINWEPSSNWFIFLSALAGVDITQYAAKSFVGVKHAQITAATFADDNATVVSKDDNAAAIAKSDNDAIVAKSDNATIIATDDCDDPSTTVEPIEFTPEVSDSTASTDVSEIHDTIQEQKG